VGCLLIIVGSVAMVGTVSEGATLPERGIAAGILALCLILGTYLQVKNKFDV
jgi:hypothetical protein